MESNRFFIIVLQLYSDLYFNILISHSDVFIKVILFCVTGRLSKDNRWSERRAEFLHIRDDKSVYEESGCCQSTSDCSGTIDIHLTFVLDSVYCCVFF